MDSENALRQPEMLFAALADKTRLRLLNVMREGEVCVGLFTKVLGDSQPKVSRHLAFLRNAGVVRARRDGKWIYYSLDRSNSDGARQVIDAVLAWLEGLPELQYDRDRYLTVRKTPDVPDVDPAPAYPIEIMSEPSLPPHRRSEAHNDLEEFLL